MRMTYTIEHRKHIEVNTDPQRRCYDGCHASSALIWTAWGPLESMVLSDKLERRLTFWRELNDYAVSERGISARCEFRAVPST
jgi:hypothetical protein